MSMVIKVEFLGGTDIKSAAEDARDLAQKLRAAYVRFNFNGTNVSVGRFANIDYVVARYEDREGDESIIVA